MEHVENPMKGSSGSPADAAYVWSSILLTDLLETVLQYLAVAISYLTLHIFVTDRASDAGIKARKRVMKFFSCFTFIY